jgi:hypothetical protein
LDALLKRILAVDGGRAVVDFRPDNQKLVFSLP